MTDLNTSIFRSLAAGGIGAAIAIGSVAIERVANLESELFSTRVELADTRAAYTAFTNDYAQAHTPAASTNDSQTNTSPAYTDTNSAPTLSQRTSAAVNYADELNQIQSH